MVVNRVHFVVSRSDYNISHNALVCCSFLGNAIHSSFTKFGWRGVHCCLTMYGAPIDLSFRNICKLTDAFTVEPRTSLRPLKRNSERKYLSSSLRLNNNNITELHELQNTVSHFLAEPSRLAWLDLSFNKILHIEQVLCELHGLRVLYLHGNNIFILSEVDRLGILPHLHSITLHGNPIETNKTYRNRVISALPRLKTVDFSAVTQQERVLAKFWHQGNTRSHEQRRDKPKSDRK